MKKNCLYILALAAALVAGCENTNENLVGERGKSVIPIMSEPSPAFFTEDLDNSYVAFDLSLPEGATLEKAELKVAYRGQ